MTNEQLESITKLRDEIEAYEKILELRRDNPTNGFAFPYYGRSLHFFEPILYRINDEKLNAGIENLIKERLRELRDDFFSIQIM